VFKHCGHASQFLQLGNRGDCTAAPEQKAQRESKNVTGWLSARLATLLEILDRAIPAHETKHCYPVLNSIAAG